MCKKEIPLHVKLEVLKIAVASPNTDLTVIRKRYEDFIALLSSDQQERTTVTAIYHKINKEIYKTLVLLGAGHDLLGTIGSLGDCLSDDDVLSGFEAWNEKTAAEIKARIEHYEISGHRPDCNQDEKQ